MWYKTHHFHLRPKWPDFQIIEKYFFEKLNCIVLLSKLREMSLFLHFPSSYYSVLLCQFFTLAFRFNPRHSHYSSVVMSVSDECVMNYYKNWSTQPCHPSGCVWLYVASQSEVFFVECSLCKVAVSSTIRVTFIFAAPEVHCQGAVWVVPAWPCLESLSLWI